MPRNKNRIYLALYQHPNGAEGGHHHQALLLMPKTPSLAEPQAPEAWRYRAARDPGSDKWSYRSQTAPVRNMSLGAVMLLGKTIMDGEEVAEMLRKVSLKDTDNCSVWTTEAIQTLIEKDLIEVPPLDLARLSRKLASLADGLSALPVDQRIRTAIPTINSGGQRIDHEIGPFSSNIMLEDIPEDMTDIWC